MKIVFISDYLHGGGAEKIAAAQCDWLNIQDGAEARFYSWGHAVCSHTATITDWLGSYPKSPRLMQAMLSRFLKELEQFAPSLVHIHNIHESRLPLELPFLLAARHPVVWTFHDLWPVTGGCCLPQECPSLAASCARGCPDDGVKRSFCSRYSAPAQFAKLQRLWKGPSAPWVIAPSRYMAGRIQHTAIGSEIPGLSVIHNGVAPFPGRPSALAATFNALPHPRILLTASSHALPYKGADAAVSLLKSVAQKGPLFSVIWLGGDSAPCAAATARFCPSLSLPFTASAERVGAVFRQADILLMPSLVENFPTTVLEAMACRLVVVAHRVGGVEEQIRNGRNGFCYTTLAEGSEALTNILTMAAPEREALGRSAERTFRDRFSMDACMREHLALYRQRIDAFSPCAPARGVPLNSWNRCGETRQEILQRWETRRIRRQQAAWAGTLRNAYVAQRLELLKRTLRKSRPAVALYGAGQHTRWLMRAILPDSGLAVKFIIDDNPGIAHLDALKVIKLTNARFAGVDAVVLSSELHEHEMHRRISALPHGDATVWELYPALPMADIVSILPPKDS